MKVLLTAIVALLFSASITAGGYHKECKMGAENNGVPYSVCMQDSMNKKR
ncbi:hypothetical protein ACPV5L_13830 [Vibrio astriarenae]|jgi:hypothetical protein|uniref:Uncharacterized protein n=1 Tax=Vibrio agarivorans TaxID=153622 RepID=A0ABT7Y182_9VIBR|nr:hypothetical protein [Vibrio agarivorans]MDN2481757.1 hypothetical protein [Vibrio agarivorans]MDN3661308.1 hypothetical protein [Vibrio agarivorans]